MPQLYLNWSFSTLTVIFLVTWLRSLVFDRHTVRERGRRETQTAAQRCQQKRRYTTQDTHRERTRNIWSGGKWNWSRRLIWMAQTSFIKSLWYLPIVCYMNMKVILYSRAWLSDFNYESANRNCGLFTELFQLNTKTLMGSLTLDTHAKVASHISIFTMFEFTHTYECKIEWNGCFKILYVVIWCC